MTEKPDRDNKRVKLNEQQLPNVVRSITAACVLHNFCLIYEDDFLEEPVANDVNYVGIVNNVEGDNIRNAILDYMIEEDLL